MLKKSENMAWWKGTNVFVDDEEFHVDTLYEVLSPGICKIKGVGDVLAGRVKQGILKRGEETRKKKMNNVCKNGDLWRLRPEQSPCSTGPRTPRLYMWSHIYRALLHLRFLPEPDPCSIGHDVAGSGFHLLWPRSMGACSMRDAIVLHSSRACEHAPTDDCSFVLCWALLWRCENTQSACHCATFFNCVDGLVIVSFGVVQVFHITLPPFFASLVNALVLFGGVPALSRFAHRTPPPFFLAFSSVKAVGGS